MTSIIVADQLTKWFGPRLAVDHVSLKVEGVASHRHGDSSSALVQMRSHGAGRLRRALESLGYDVRKIIPALSTEIPADCAVVVDVNPRTIYLPGESDALLTDLAQGGAALLLYDLGFVQIVGGRRRARRRDRPPRPLLDPPRYTATLYRRGTAVLAAEFGAPNPQKVLQYMKLMGRDQVFLMSRFVGEEWEQAIREASGR